MVRRKEGEEEAAAFGREGRANREEERKERKEKKGGEKRKFVVFFSHIFIILFGIEIENM